LIRLVGELHSHNIIYGDTYNGNVIINDSEVFLIDFDKAFFSDQVPKYFSEMIIERPITSDIFCLQSLIKDIFPSYKLGDSQTTEISDLLTIVNGFE
jgi:tRNA A-37 threonylcarbamoyl transferase component Bud32